MSTTPRPAAIYARQSHTTDGSESLATQVRNCQAAADRFGVEVVAELIEAPSTSGFRDRGLDRPKWNELLALLRNRDIEVVIADKTDRLSRGGGPGWAPLFTAADKDDKTGRTSLDLDRFVLIAGNGYMAEFELSIRSSMDREESKKQSERQRDQHLANARSGKFAGGGFRQFGYADLRKTEVNEEEAEVIRGAAQRLLAGASKAEVVRWMNERSTGTGGRPWHSLTMRRLLDSAAIAGIREHHVKDPTRRYVASETAAWPAIIDVETHRRLRALLSVKQHRRSASRYLLTGGLARCGLCGAPLAAQPRKAHADGTPHLAYRCPQPGSISGFQACGRIRIVAKEFEAFVVEEALMWATSPEVISRRDDQRRAMAVAEREARDALDRLATREQTLTDLVVDGEISRADHKRKRDELTAEREGAERRLATVTNRLSPALARGRMDEIRARWDELTLNERRAVLKSLLVEVVVKPGVPGLNRFDPRRVSIRPDWGPLLDSAATGGPLTKADREGGELFVLPD